MNKYSAYLLGYIWADGHIVKYKLGNYNIQIYTKESDSENLINMCNATGKWNIYVRNIRERSKEKSVTLSTSNKDIYNFLLNHGYGSNSKISADSILNVIPKDLHKYWFRGLICGDGCFYVDAVNKRKAFTLAGPFGQNWDFVINLFNELTINKYYINTKEAKKGSYSNISVQSYSNIIKLGDYIYDGFELDKIGLQRKYDKFVLIKNMCKRDSDGNITNNNKLSTDQIIQIKTLYDGVKFPSRKLGKMFSVDKSTILDIINGKLHKDV